MQKANNNMWMRYDMMMMMMTRKDKTPFHDSMMMDFKQMKIYMIEKKTPPRNRNHRQRLENDIDAQERNNEQ